MTAMIGTIERAKGTCTRTLHDMMEVLRAERGMSLNQRRLLYRMTKGGNPVRKDRMSSLRLIKQVIRGLQECESLEAMFPLVELDTKCTRKVNASTDGYKTTIDIPLIWSVKLPCRAGYMQQNFTNYNVRALIPSPPPEAINALKEHKSKFDEMQVWWVPNDVLVTPIPKPDPILVGVKKLPNMQNRYFSIYRWVDEAFESGWWAREAY